MPTLIRFAGGDSLVVHEDFAAVNTQLQQGQRASFTDQNGNALTVLSANILSIQPQGEGGWLAGLSAE